MEDPVDAGRSLLLLLALLTALNWAVHFYTQTVTYRLFPTVAQAAGGPGFVRYHRAYEARLPWSVYVPWTLLTLTSLAFVFLRPDGVGPAWPVVLFVLNASIAPISLLFAAPVHRAVDRTGDLTAAQAAALLRWNGVRLVVATASLAVVGALAAGNLATA
jgi:hypothetical protein